VNSNSGFESQGRSPEYGRVSGQDSRAKLDEQRFLLSPFRRFWRQGKMLDWAVLFFITAMLAAVAGYLVGNSTGFFNYAWLLSIASLLLGLIGVFLDKKSPR